MNRTPPGARDVVLHYHPHSGRNPYQSMLYGACASARIEPRRLDDLGGLDAIPVTDKDVVAAPALDGHRPAGRGRPPPRQGADQADASHARRVLATAAVT